MAPITTKQRDRLAQGEDGAGGERGIDDASVLAVVDQGSKVGFLVGHTVMQGRAEDRITSGHHQGFEHECVAAELPVHEVGTERTEHIGHAGAGTRSEELGDLLHQHDVEGVEEEIPACLPSGCRSRRSSARPDGRSTPRRPSQYRAR